MSVLARYLQGEAASKRATQSPMAAVALGSPAMEGGEGGTEAAVVRGLMARGLPPHLAYGVAGNISAESNFDPGINEINPVVPGSRGGFGINQWTGPRRVAYENFAKERGKPLDDLDTQLDFTMWELQNTERAAGSALMTARTPEEAARIYSERFLRPGIPRMDHRVAEARRIAGIYANPMAQYAGAP